MNYKQVIDFFKGDRKAIAAIVGITESGVRKWEDKGLVPFHQQKKLEKHTKGVLKDAILERAQEKVFIDKEGAPSNLQIEKSSGHSLLDDVALKAVKKWKFHPAQLGTISVESSVLVPVRFSLENS